MTARSRTMLGAGVGLLCAIVVLGPALAPGYLLRYDMVFVPHLPLSARTLGLDGSVPRAVPNDAVVAVLSMLVPGWVVQKLLLVAVFVGVGAGVARLARSGIAAVVAAVVACWNPYVAERLSIGHWPFLLAYGLVPWAAVAARSARRADRWGLLHLALAVIGSALTGSTGAVLCLVVVAAVLLVPAELPVRSAAIAAAALLAVLANATWWVPFLFFAPASSADPAGVTAFASRADTAYGVLGSLLTGGGIWNKGVWLASRGSAVLSGLALVVTVGCAVVAARTSRMSDAATRGAGVAGLVGLVLSGIGSVPGGATMLTWVVTTVPGGGLLRDAQKFVGLWIIVVAVAAGHCAALVWDRGHALDAPRLVRGALVAALAAWPVLTLPDLAWGAAGRWQSVRYPSSYLRTAQHLDELPHGRVLVLPWTLYRRFAWADQVVLLDPWQRLVERDVVVSDDLPLTSSTVRGEDPDARTLSRVIASGGQLAPAARRLGIRWIVVETDQPGASSLPDLGDAAVVWRAPGIEVRDLGPVSAASGRATHPPIGWWVGASSLVVSGALAVNGWQRHRRPGEGAE